jgi:hypothetical protein
MNMPEEVLDFPELYPLCQAREVRGNFVKYCLCPAEPGGLCSTHAHWKKNAQGEWDGFEMNWKKYEETRR